MCALRDGSIALANDDGVGTVCVFPPGLGEPTLIDVADSKVLGVAETRKGHFLLTSSAPGAGHVWV
jgi:hypothetical protein